MEETRKRRRPRKRWKYEAKEDLNIIRTKKQAGNGQRPSGWKNIVLKCKADKGLWQLEEEEGRRRRRRRRIGFGIHKQHFTVPFKNCG